MNNYVKNSHSCRIPSVCNFGIWILSCNQSWWWKRHSERLREWQVFKLKIKIFVFLPFFLYPSLSKAFEVREELFKCSIMSWEVIQNYEIYRFFSKFDLLQGWGKSASEIGIGGIKSVSFVSSNRKSMTNKSFQQPNNNSGRDNQIEDEFYNFKERLWVQIFNLYQKEPLLFLILGSVIGYAIAPVIFIILWLLWDALGFILCYLFEYYTNFIL